MRYKMKSHHTWCYKWDIRKSGHIVSRCTVMRVVFSRTHTHKSRHALWHQINASELHLIGLREKSEEDSLFVKNKPILSQNIWPICSAHKMMFVSRLRKKAVNFLRRSETQQFYCTFWNGRACVNTSIIYLQSLCILCVYGAQKHTQTYEQNSINFHINDGWLWCVRK